MEKILSQKQKIFCTNCWAEVGPEESVCQWCSSDLSVFSGLSYEEKLINALMHFEPQTAMRAAEILAMRKAKAGADAIADAFVNRADLDPIMARAFLKAIEGITGKTEAEIAARLKEKGGFASEVASRITDSVLGS